MCGSPLFPAWGPSDPSVQEREIALPRRILDTRPSWDSRRPAPRRSAARPRGDLGESYSFSNLPWCSNRTDHPRSDTGGLTIISRLFSVRAFRQLDVG